MENYSQKEIKIQFSKVESILEIKSICTKLLYKNINILHISKLHTQKGQDDKFCYVYTTMGKQKSCRKERTKQMKNPF